MTPEQWATQSIRNMEEVFDSNESETILDAVEQDTKLSREIIEAAYNNLYPEHARIVQPTPEMVRFINRHFESNDVICVVLIDPKTDKTKNFFTRPSNIDDEFIESLHKENQTQNVYLGMNAYNPDLLGDQKIVERKGRTEKNVVAIRNLYADADHDGAAVLEKIKASTVVPGNVSTVLESSPGKFNIIWRVGDVSKDEAKPILKAMAQTFNTDTAVTDLARILRIPGFQNVKYVSRPIVKIASESDGKYSRSDFKVKMAPEPQAETKPTAGEQPEKQSDTPPCIRAIPSTLTSGDFDGLLAALPTVYDGKSGSPNPEGIPGRDVFVYKVCCKLQAIGWTDSDIYEAADKVAFEKTVPVFEEHRTKARSALTEPKGTPPVQVPFEEGYKKAAEEREAKAQADAAAKAEADAARAAQQDTDATAHAEYEKTVAANAANASNNGNAELTFKYPAITGSHRDYVVAPKLGQTEGWFPLGDPNLVGGSSGSGKTTWVMEILEKQARKETVYGHQTFGRSYLVIMLDRGENAFKRTMERMDLDSAKIPIKRLSPITGDAALQAILNKIEEDGEDNIPQIVFIEGGDMLVEDANKGQFVTPFMTGIQSIAKHYHIGFILSVGAPEMRIGEGYVAKRDSILGSEKWSRTAEAVVALQYIKGDDTDKERECFVMLRNAPPEMFRLIMERGRLMEHTKTPTEQASKTPEIVWFKNQALLGKTDPDKAWWTSLDMERDMEVSAATARRWIADAHTKGYIVKKRGPDNKVGKAPQYQWNESKTNPLWRDPNQKPDVSLNQTEEEFASVEF